MTQLNTALFIDYDNVRTELDRYDPAVASRFSNKPPLWLSAIEKQMELPGGEGFENRRIVSRRCYASPQMINVYRRNFTQSGFEVIDCPPLTSNLKNSADIYIVMDVIDYLARYPHIDEYIILSGDADFVPVLNRLRKELKRTAIFTAYNTASAYRNCSDRTIEPDFFARYLAVETVAPRPVQDATTAKAATKKPATQALRERGPETLDPELGAAIEACLRRAAKPRYGRLSFALAGNVLRDGLQRELGTDWAGYGTMSALLAQLEASSLDIDPDKQEIYDQDFEADLGHWSEGDRDRLGEFASDILWACEKPVPLLPPASYTILFDALAAAYRSEEPKTFQQAVTDASELCGKQGIEASPQEVRFVATGLLMQGHRFSADDEPRLLASLWREQVFDLCGQPDWMREPEKAALLVTWFRAQKEGVHEARRDFLARTAEDKHEETSEGDAL